MTVRIRHPFNYYLRHWDAQQRGYFVEIEPIEPHPADCQCVGCRPRPPRQYREYDELDAKQNNLFWR